MPTQRRNPQFNCALTRPRPGRPDGQTNSGHGLTDQGTTVRVSRATRDHLNKVSTEQGETVDATIQRGLDLLDREQRRRTAELDAWAAGQDVEDQTELRAAMADLAGD